MDKVYILTCSGRRKYFESSSAKIISKNAFSTYEKAERHIPEFKLRCCYSNPYSAESFSDIDPETAVINIEELEIV